MNAELHALTQVTLEIGNYTRAIAGGLYVARCGARRCGASPGNSKAELAQLEGSQQAPVLEVTVAMLERHLQGLTKKLRNGVEGKVREAIQESVARILVGVDGNLTIEAKPRGLLGVEGMHVRMDDEG